MRPVKREVEEEPIIGVALDKGLGSLTLYNHPVTPVADPLVRYAVTGQVKVCPVGIGWPNPILVKPAAPRVILGIDIIIIPAMPFSRKPRHIAKRLHTVTNRQQRLPGHIGACRIGPWHHSRTLSRIRFIAVKAEFVLDSPGHQTHTRRPALRRRGIALRHQRPAAGQRVHVWRIDIGIDTEQPHIRVAVIIGVNEDDIRTMGFDRGKVPRGGVGTTRKGIQGFVYNRAGINQNRIVFRGHKVMGRIDHQNRAIPINLAGVCNRDHGFGCSIRQILDRNIARAHTNIFTERHRQIRANHHIRGFVERIQGRECRSDNVRVRRRDITQTKDKT